jgi:hypothetical protein
MRLTHYGLLNLQEVVALGDLLLLPRDTSIPLEAVRSLELLGLLPATPSGKKTTPNMYCFEHVRVRYSEYRHRLGREPAWLTQVPIAVQKWLRLQYATQEEASEIFYRLPYTGISYAISDGGLHFALCRACNVWRLTGIKQLGFLQAPDPDERLLGRQPLSEGNRYVHSADVMAIATIIARNLDLPRSLANTVRAAAILHDIGTPAGGDSVKMIDVEGLDEDLNFASLLAYYDVDGVLSEYGIDRSLLCEAIMNRGIAGEILDIADKLAYTGRDLSQTWHHIRAAAGSFAQPGLKTLAEHVERYGEVCSVWDCVVECEGHAAFSGPDRLGGFLRVRALMFRELYYHPRTRFAEFLISRLVVKALYRRGLVTRESLRTMTDYDLIRIMELEYGSGPYSLVSVYDPGLARVRSFETLEEAERFAQHLREQGTSLALIDDDRKAIKVGGHLLVQKNGKAVPFSEASPTDYREIQEIAQLYPMVRVYYLEGEPRIPREKLEELINGI